jgi:hypothetical protein
MNTLGIQQKKGLLVIFLLICGQHSNVISSDQPRSTKDRFSDKVTDAVAEKTVQLAFVAACTVGYFLYKHIKHRIYGNPELALQQNEETFAHEIKVRDKEATARNQEAFNRHIEDMQNTIHLRLLLREKFGCTKSPNNKDARCINIDQGIMKLNDDIGHLHHASTNRNNIQ